MKKIALILIAFLSVSLVQAQSNNERKAQKILNKLGRNYKQLKSLKATFEMRITEPGSSKPQIEKGTIYVMDKNFKLEMSNVDIICNGKTQWYYMKDINEVQISNYQPNDDQISPSNIFTIYEKGFKYQWVEERNENGQIVDIIELAPKDNPEKKEYTKIKLAVDKQAKQIISSEVFFRSGRKMKYTIGQQVNNIHLADNFFDFDPASKKGIQVVDLR